MHEIKTLYLQNLPMRPRSRKNFTKLLLRHINPTNEYLTDSNLSLPRNEPKGNADLQMLDTKNSIVAISLSRSIDLRNQCFITFKDKVSAENFMTSFRTNLNINGRKIDIQFASKDSLLGLALDNVKLLDKALKTRDFTQKLKSDTSLKQQHILKRRLRRLRSKLRSKGTEEDTIKQISEQMRRKKQDIFDTITDSKKLSKTKQVQEKKRALATTSENPPNKILLIQNLPKDAKIEDLNQLFQDENLVEVRLVNIRNVAFVEYQSTEDAKRIKGRLGSTYQYQNQEVLIGFAK